MPWTPIERPQQLVGRHETSSFDWKQAYDFDDPTTAFEVAKDAAALASAMGGTVLVGAIEGQGDRRGTAVRFFNITEPGRMVTQISDAVRLHTRPLPVFEPRVITLTPAEQHAVLGRDGETHDVSVIAINVQPLPSGPVAVRTTNGTRDAVAHAYRFPIRGGEGTRYLQPEELALHYSAHERKISVLLRRIPDILNVDGVRPQIRVFDDHHRQTNLIREIVRIDDERMMCVLRLQGMNAMLFAHVPFAFIRAVWQDEHGVWSIFVEGFVFEDILQPSRPQFVPTRG